MQFKPALIKLVDDIVKRVIEVIEVAEAQPEAFLGHDEVGYLYSVLGIFACN